jgi:hypothetical protein
MVTMTQLSDYYRDRAAEYDAIYAKPERQDDLATLRGPLTRLAGGRILETAAGTGYWTQVLSASAARFLDGLRARLGPGERTPAREPR